MHSFRRFAFLLALALPVTPAVVAQSSSSSSDATPAQNQAQPQAPALSPQQLTVQARIRARREQRRAAAIHDAYSHMFDIYSNMGYLRFIPGPSRQRATMYAWDVGVTRYYNERFGVTVDGRGYYGTAYVGLNASNITRPAISEYSALAGPTYRFYLQPKYSVAGRVMAGFAHGNFSGDTNGFGSICINNQTGASTSSCLLYPNSNTFAASAAIVGEANLTPNVAFRLAPEYFATGFGSTVQNSRGFTLGLVYRFGKQ